MQSRLLVSLCVSLGAALGAPGQALAQKGKPPADVPGEARFRCPAEIDCVGSDGIKSDGRLYVGIGAAETGQGAILNVSNHELWLGFGENIYPLFLDLVQIDPGAPCLPTGMCRLIDPLVTIDNEDGEFQSNVLGPGDGDAPAANGLLDVPINETWRSRLKISFYDPWGRDLLWNLHFNTIDYAGASNINVTRTDVCSWVFEPGSSDRGGLSAWGNATKGKRVRTDEGLYLLPFRIKFTVPSLCP
jgi:hypothetical protein